MLPKNFIAEKRDDKEEDEETNKKKKTNRNHKSPMTSISGFHSLPLTSSNRSSGKNVLHFRNVKMQLHLLRSMFNCSTSHRCTIGTLICGGTFILCDNWTTFCSLFRYGSYVARVLHSLTVLNSIEECRRMRTNEKIKRNTKFD